MATKAYRKRVLLKDDLVRLRSLLVKDWQGTADLFIPLKEESIVYLIKNDEPYDVDQVLKRELQLLMIRNNLHSSRLRRSFTECTAEEIAGSKIRRLIDLLKRRPELIKLLKDRIWK